MEYGISGAEMLKLMKGEAKALDLNYKVESDGQIHLVPVVFHKAGKEVGVAACAVYSCLATGKVHNFVIAYDPYSDTFAHWCGDQFLEGNLKDLTARRSLALDYLASKGITPSLGGVKLADSSWKMSSGCNFWKNDRACKHMRGVFHTIIREEGAEKFLSRLQDGAKPLMPGSPGAGAAAATPRPVVDPIIAKLRRYGFKFNALLRGDKGWGKTHAITQFSMDEESGIEQTVYIGGHEGLESVDLLGHMIRTESGAMAWKDGKLTQAFRYASIGVKTLVVFDEILRVRKRELSVLVAALAPHADGKLYLPTGRPEKIHEGIAAEEVLTCERENLWVVATTNVGAGYEVDDMEEALSDRFPIVLNVAGGAGELRAKLGPVVAAKGLPGKVLDQMVDFYNDFQRLRNAGELTRQLNLRHLCEVVAMADGPGDLRELISDRLPQWVEIDTFGGFVEKQQEAVVRLIAARFPR